MAHPYLSRPRVASGATTAMAPAAWVETAARAVPRPAFAYALAAYLAVTVARAHEVVPFLSQLSPAKLSLLFVIGMLATNPRQLPWGDLPRSTVAKFMFATAILAVLSVPGAYWPGGSAKFLPYVYLQTFIVFVLVATAFVHRRTMWIGLHVFAFGAMAAAVLGFLVPPDRTGRFGIGRTYDPNDTAAFLVIALPFVFLLATESRRVRQIAFVGIPIMLAAIMKTGSRGGIVALALMIPFMLFYAPPRRRTTYIGLVAVCLAVFSATMTPELRKRFVALFEQSDYNFHDRDGRKAVIKRGIGYMVANPVFGVGIDGFQYAEGATKRNEGEGVKYMNAHNAYVQIGAELGFGGLLCFVGTIVASWLGVRRVRKQLLGPEFDPVTSKREVGVATAALCALVGLSAAAMFLSTAYSPVTYFMFGLCAAIPLGAPVAGRLVAAAPASPALRRMASASPSPRPAAPARGAPQRVRGWLNGGRSRQTGPSRGRGGLNR